MEFYLSNKSNLNSNVDNVYKNKNSNRTKKKKKRDVENRTKKKKKTHIRLRKREKEREVELISHVPEIFFLSYSFVMFRIDFFFFLSIWVNLHIYIDIVFMGLVLRLKFLLIIFLYCT